MKYSFEAKLAAVEREIALRKQVYPGSVKAGRMKKEDADYQIRIMEAIAADYRRAIERREVQKDERAALENTAK